MSVAGTGFIGLVSAVCFANKGFITYASTHNKQKADAITKGEPPFYERGLEPLLKQVIQSGKFKVVLGRKEAVLNSDIIFITVGTPMKHDNSIDLQYIEQTATQIGEALKEKDDYLLVVVRSTVVPGTTRGLVLTKIEEASGKKAGKDFGLSMNPEFLREGEAIHDTLHPDRIVIGELDKRSGDLLESLYRDFYGKDIPPLLRVNLETAELTKYGANCLLATKISFVNELARIAELIPSIDLDKVVKSVGLDFRINPRFLRAGVGFGGSCLPKDVNAIIAFSNQKGLTPSLMESVLKRNYEQAVHTVDLVEEEIGNLKDKRIAILGLAFKPNTDDMRQAPSIKIIDILISRGAKEIVGFDPQAMKTAQQALNDKIMYAVSVEDCLKDADACILVTEWDEFKSLTPDTFKNNMRTPVLIDGRRIYNAELFSTKLKYRAIGRG